MSPELRALRAGLESGTNERVEVIVDELTRRAWIGQVAAEHLDEAMALLQQHGRFSSMVGLGDAALAADSDRWRVRRRYWQALIELGALGIVEPAIQSALEQDLDVTERSEALGLLGRIAKQRYVARRAQADLDLAVSWYRNGWDHGADPQWHGVNLAALYAVGKRSNQSVECRPGVEEIPDLVMASIAASSDGDDPRDDWSLAAEAELRLAAGDEEGAAEVVSRMAAGDTPVFQLQSLRRQLIEVWGLDRWHRLVLALDDRLAGMGELVIEDAVGSAPGDGAASPIEQFEKVFGTAQALGYDNLATGLATACSVGKVMVRGDRGLGTAFLLRGDLIHDRLGPDPLLVTNAHVIDNDRTGPLPAEDAIVRFQVGLDLNGRQLVCDKLRVIWSSPFRDCDVTLLRFGSGEPDLPKEIAAASGLPASHDGVYVTVIGHPAAGELSLSLRGNDLLEYDESERRMHYLAPTKPGSSGSPVFDPNWQLIGVHHAGHRAMRRLAGPGVHSANEATTLGYLRDEYQRSLQRS